MVRRSYLSRPEPQPVELGEVDDFDTMLESTDTAWNLEWEGKPITTIAALINYLGADTLPIEQARERVAEYRAAASVGERPGRPESKQCRCT